MKVLLTGEPHSGKTTVLAKFLETVPDKQGFLAEEILENGERTGFRLVSSIGKTATLASITSKSETRVSRYGVELSEVSEFIKDLPSIQPGKLLYIDEIGRMELYSDAFKELVSRYLDTDNPYIGTIASNYNDEFIEAIKKRPDISIVEVTSENRNALVQQLHTMVFGSTS
jgi:nucleoside-triphosphatase